MIRIDHIETDKDGVINLSFTEGDPLPKIPSGAGRQFNNQFQFDEWISRNSPEHSVDSKIAAAFTKNAQDGATAKEIEGKEFAVGAVEVPKSAEGAKQ